jgi:hypothetical protein
VRAGSFYNSEVLGPLPHEANFVTLHKSQFNPSVSESAPPVEATLHSTLEEARDSFRTSITKPRLMQDVSSANTQGVSSGYLALDAVQSPALLELCDLASSQST